MDTHEIQGTIKEAQGAVEKGYGRLKDKVGETFKDLKGSAAYSQATDRVSENPGLSLAIAAGIGFLLGSLLSRRD